MSNNDNQNNKNIIKIKLREDLDQKKIISEYYYHIPTKSIKLSLNSKYQPPVNCIFKINIDEWDKNAWKINKILRPRGIDPSEIQLCEMSLDDTWQEIWDTYNNNNNSSRDYNNENQQEQDDQEQEKEERKFLPQILVELVLENHIKLFKDEFKIPHIQVKLNNHYKTLPIDSTKFIYYLHNLYSNAYEGRIANAEAINSAISRLEAKAFYEGQMIPLHLRVAWDNPDTTDSIYYDLSDDKNRCIKVSRDGWQIVDNQTDVLFRMQDHFKPQVDPITTTTTNFDTIDSIDSKMFDEFISLFNLKTNKENTEDIKLLLKCYIISLFIPEIPKPILLLHGEQGGAKSTFQELIKMLVDPSTTQTFTFPRDSSEFVQQLSHNPIAYYDNVSDIQDWISDLLCRAVTGSSFSKRALYTNDDDIYYNFKRIIGINGIDLAATKADLLDRGLIIQTERIDKKDRKKIKKIWEQFNQLKPYVLGYIFDILVKVLRYRAEHGEIDFPNGLNRMADWEEYAEIISRCMGNNDGKFQDVYAENIGVQVDEAIESSPLSQAVIEFMSEEIVIGIELGTNKEIKIIREEWTGTPTELHTMLQNIVIAKLNLIVSKSKSWPKSASALTRKINSVKTNLREKGIEIILGRDEKGNRTITISKMPSMPSKLSKTTESSTNQQQKIDSKYDNEQMPSKMPSNENEQIQAQKSTLDGIDSTDSNLQASKEDEQEERKEYNVKDFMTVNHLNKVKVEDNGGKGPV